MEKISKKSKKIRKVKEHLASFNIAGFTYYDGVEVFKDLEIGLLLELHPEPDNKFNPQAIMIWYKNSHLGYIPRSENSIFYKLLRVGITQIEVRVQRVDPQEHPENQVSVVTFLVGE